jgi:hypothetical protein
VAKTIGIVLFVVGVVVFTFLVSQYLFNTNYGQEPYNPPDDDDDNHHGGGGGNDGGGGGGDDDQNEDDGNDQNENNNTDINKINTVNISPNETTTSIYQPFTVTILCEPIQMIKAWEITISYDPLYLQVADVTQGNIFNGYETFPSPDTVIDNVNGTITRLYSLILGKDSMVMNNGSLASIQFISMAIGKTNIDITMVGLTNSTMYIPVQIFDGTVIIK